MNDKERIYVSGTVPGRKYRLKTDLLEIDPRLAIIDQPFPLLAIELGRLVQEHLLKVGIIHARSVLLLAETEQDVDRVAHGGPVDDLSVAFESDLSEQRRDELPVDGVVGRAEDALEEESEADVIDEGDFDGGGVGLVLFGGKGGSRDGRRGKERGELTAPSTAHGAGLTEPCRKVRVY